MSSRTLALTTPNIRGTDVETLQNALKTNVFDKAYYDGPVDGVYGTLTAQAVHRAEFWIGVRKPDQKTSGNLYAYLTGKKPLTLAMRARRATRLRVAAKKRPLRLKAYDLALSQVGVSESPAGSNRQKYGEWYGWNGVAWCAMFQSWCYHYAGSVSINPKLARWAYCPYVVSDARAGRNGLSLTIDPKRGDWVLYDWNSDGVADHIGMFDAWIDQKAGTFSTIEGNTSPTNASNGGMVVHYGTGVFKPRSKKDVICFVHVAA